MLLFKIKDFFSSNARTLMLLAVGLLWFWGYANSLNNEILTSRVETLELSVERLQTEKETLITLMESREDVNATIQRQVSMLTNNFNGIHKELGSLRAGLGEITEPGEEIDVIWRAYSLAGGVVQ